MNATWSDKRAAKLQLVPVGRLGYGDGDDEEGGGGGGGGGEEEEEEEGGLSETAGI